MKSIPFPASLPTPAQAETSTISAKGENGLWDDEDRHDLSSRARRELSVIEESSSIALRDEGDGPSEVPEESERFALPTAEEAQDSEAEDADTSREEAAKDGDEHDVDHQADGDQPEVIRSTKLDDGRDPIITITT